MNDQITTLTQENFGEFIKNNDCAVVFFKNKCPNCKVLLKVMEKCKAIRPDMVMACINSETDETVAKTLDINRVPTVLIYKGGALRIRKTGIIKPIELETLYTNA